MRISPLSSCYLKTMHLRLVAHRALAHMQCRMAYAGGRAPAVYLLTGVHGSFQPPINVRTQTRPSKTAPRSSKQGTNPTQSGSDRVLRRKEQKQKEQAAYFVVAVAASSCIIFIAVVATYCRFTYNLHQGEAVPTLEWLSCLALVAGGCIGMEGYARFAHKTIWHEGPGWSLHRSHHVPRTGAFEANDVFAVMNAVPAIGLCFYGFLRTDVIGGLCFGAGLGISLFGIAYMFVHDGLIHKRFAVGPIAELPALRRIAVAHTIHHQDKYGGVPFGLFLGPQELEAVGAKEELDRQVADAERSRNQASAANK